MGVLTEKVQVCWFSVQWIAFQYNPASRIGFCCLYTIKTDCSEELCKGQCQGELWTLVDASQKAPSGKSPRDNRGDSSGATGNTEVGCVFWIRTDERPRVYERYWAHFAAEIHLSE